MPSSVCWAGLRHLAALVLHVFAGRTADASRARENCCGVSTAEEHWHAGVELHAHQAVDDGGGDKLVAVDAAVDDEAAGDDRVGSCIWGERCQLLRRSGISKAPGTSYSLISTATCSAVP